MLKNLKFKIKNSQKGVSLPLAMGLMTLIMMASMAANEMVISALKSVRSIEASNRAYFAAEGGVEDALYEVSSHVAGYQTPTLEKATVRNAEFGTIGPWDNKWAVESRSGEKIWPKPEIMLKGQKLILSLYADNSVNNVGTNAINPNPADIENLKPGIFSIKFSIPEVTGISTIMGSTGNILRIDNDQDGKVGEDPPGTISVNCPDGSINPNPADDDCDGKVDEDSDFDPVILWKLTDNNGRSLIPLKGCLEDTGIPPGVAPDYLKSEFCEKDFKWVGVGSVDNWSETLDNNAYGENEKGVPQTIGDFIAKSILFSDDRMQFEFLIVAPMEFLDPNMVASTKIPIPYIEYGVVSDNTEIPYPYFRIKSDGYYGTYKQSITTTLLPKTTVPLFDFTIIQQQ